MSHIRRYPARVEFDSYSDYYTACRRTEEENYNDCLHKMPPLPPGRPTKRLLLWVCVILPAIWLALVAIAYRFSS